MKGTESTVRREAVALTRTAMCSRLHVGRAAMALQFCRSMAVLGRDTWLEQLRRT